MVGPEEFRRTLGWLAGGVTVISSIDDAGRPVGLTATAVCSVSLEPPLVMACVSRGSTTHAAIVASSRFALNILPASARALADRFATGAADKFAGVDWTAGSSGCPLLQGATAVCECSLEESIAAGDHTIFVGRVEGTHVRVPAGDEPPALLYYRGAYASTRPVDETG